MAGEGSGRDGLIRDFLSRAAQALKGLDKAYESAVPAAGPYAAFQAVLARDARDSLAAVELVLAQPAIGKVCAVIVDLAHGDFRAAQAIMAKSPRRAVRAPRIMGEAYKIILEGLVARGFAPRRERVRLSRAKLLFIVLRNLL